MATTALNSADAPNEVAVKAAPSPSQARDAGFLMLALVVAMTIAFIDRQLLNLLVDPIRKDVGITDAQFSLLQGASFSIIYVFAMLPIAWASDHFNRKYILIFSIAAWSLMTVAFGLAGGFLGLLAARACVAIGEAGSTPASVSMLRDAYPKHRQAAAVSALTVGTYLGGGISLSVGGPALDWLSKMKLHSGLPGGLAPWRLLFCGAGALGLVAIALLLFIREPGRTAPRNALASWREYLRLLKIERARAVAFLCAFIGIVGMSTAAPAWLPALFMRRHGWSAHTAGLAFGMTHLVFGIVGALGAGWLVDRLTARGRAMAHVTILRWGVLAIGVGGALSAILPDAGVALAFSCLGQLGVGACLALGALGFQAMFPMRFSGRGVATYLLATNIFGAAVGPTAVPLVAGLLHDPKAIGPALMIWTSLAAVWSLGWLLRLGQVSAGGAAS